MINAVSSITASNSTAAARPHAEENAARRAGVESSVATTLPTAAAPVSATVSISEQANKVALTRTVDTAAPTKPDWSFAPSDGNKDGRVTYFEQQFYDIRNFPDSLKQVLDLNQDVVPPPVQPAPQAQQAQQARAPEQVESQPKPEQKPEQRPEPAQAAPRSAASADLKAYEDVARAGRGP